VKTEEKRIASDLIGNGSSFLEEAFDLMHETDIRRELFRNRSKEGMNN
jgi:hypothetical protein